jgi:hypothetical protein
VRPEEHKRSRPKLLASFRQELPIKSIVCVPQVVDRRREKYEEEKGNDSRVTGIAFWPCHSDFHVKVAVPFRKTLDWGGKGGEGGGNEGVQKMVLARLHIFLCRQ